MAENLIGLEKLEARLLALSSAKMGPAAMRLLGAAAVGEAKLLVRRKTGALGRSISYGNVTPTGVTIRAGMPYAPFVEFGTQGGTVITPKVARVLAWGGARRLTGSLRSGSKPTAFAMRVVRRATRPYPYLLPGAKKAVSAGGLKDIIINAWNSAA